MGSIYDKAETVHIWLGPSSPDIDLLMEQMAQLDKRVIKRADYRRSSPNAWLSEWPLLIQNMEAGGVNKSFNTRRRSALIELLGRPWFERVWILQEVFNANTAVIRCGKKAIPTRTFVMMPRLLYVDADPHVQAVLDIMPGYLREASWWRGRPNLRTLLEKFYDSVAKDERDKIYALLGIASDIASHEILQPDSYQISLSKTIEITVHYLLFGQVVNDSMLELPGWSFSNLPSDLGCLPGSVLFWALENGFEHTAVEVINRTSIDINKPMIPGKPVPLLFLAEQKHFTAVMKAVLRRNDVDINIRCESGGATPLSIALKHRNVKTMRLLLGHPDIDLHQTYCGRTLLELAAETGDVALFEPVLARLNFQCSSSKWDVWRSPLVIAAKQGWKAQVQGILKKHNALKPLVRNAALYAAAENGHSEVVEFLLDQDADMNALLFFGETTLCVAAGHNHLEVVKLFLARGLEANSDTMNSKSDFSIKISLKNLKGAVSYDVNLAMALLEACGKGHTGVVQSLLDAGANVNAVFSECSNRSTSALWVACQNGRVEVVELLCRTTKAQVNPSFNRYEPSPLWIACWGGHQEIVRLLLHHGADVNVYSDYHPDLNGLKSVLWLSRRMGHARIKAMLLMAGAKDKLVSNLSDGNALWLAVGTGQIEAIKTILDEGGNIETKDQNGSSLLWIAAYMGEPEVVSLLVRRGADLNALGASWGLKPCTPQVAAREGEHYKVVQILEEAAVARGGVEREP